MKESITKIEEFYKSDLDYLLTRHLSVGLDESRFEYELKLSSDCPYYSDGIRGLKRKKQGHFIDQQWFLDDIYYLEIDLSFLNSNIFQKKHTISHRYFLIVISNENNLTNLNIDLSSFGNDIPRLYFLIDMSNNRLQLKEDSEIYSGIDFDFYEYLSWLDSGLNIELYSYSLTCSNFMTFYYINSDILLKDLLNNFNRLFLTRDSNKPMHLSSKYENYLYLYLVFSFDGSIEKFNDFISSLKSILSNNCNYSIVSVFDFQVVFLSCLCRLVFI